MTHSRNLNSPYDSLIFPYILRNNSQYRKRFHISNYHEFKVNFISGTEIPVKYDFLYDQRYEKKLQRLVELETKILPQSNVGELIEKLYKAKIVEKRKLLMLVRSAYEAQANTPGGSEAAHTFNQLTKEVFGAPSLDVFRQLMSTINDDISSVGWESKNSEAYHRFSQIALASEGESTITKFTPAPRKDLSDHSSFVSEANEVVAFFKGKMLALGLHDWAVQISDKPIESFRVYGKRKVLLVPKTSVIKSRKNERRLSIDVMEGLFAHEVLTHVIRGVNGAQSGLLLLSHGLAGYLPGEEGIATFREQQYSSAKDYAGKTMYLALGLAYGLDRNGQPRTFREVYEILSDYFTLKFGGFSKKVQAKAFVTCARIFVVSPHQNIPLIFTRDIVYREGNIAINTAVQADDTLLEIFDVGKFNPVNTEHVAILKSLNII